MDERPPTAFPGSGHGPPALSELLGKLRPMEAEIGCDGKRTAAHTYPSRVVFRDAERNAYVLKDIVPEAHMGCGCWAGVHFVLEREPD